MPAAYGQATKRNPTTRTPFGEIWSPAASTHATPPLSAPARPQIFEPADPSLIQPPASPSSNQCDPGLRLAGVVPLPADGRLATLDGARPQGGDHLVGGGLRHLDQREPIGDLDGADVPPAEPR